MFGLKECDGKPKISYVTVFERPGLREFLKQIGEFAVLVLFTAGLEGWMLFYYFQLCLSFVKKYIFGLFFS